MNCRQFASIVTELATGRLDSGTIEAAEAHAGECRACRTRFEAEQHLTTALLRLADQDSEARPSVYATEALRGEFDRYSAKRVRASAAARMPLWARFAGIAAMLAVSVWWAARLVEPPRDISTTAQPKPAASESSGVPAQAPPSSEAADFPVNLPEEAPHQVAERELPSRQARAETPSREAVEPTQPDPQAPSGSPETGVVRREVATSFIPLRLGEPLPASSSATLVRVQLSSTALQYFGLAVEPEVSPGLIEADVLLGEDGLARAVRFVSPLTIETAAMMPPDSH
jgi:hypothetical protein